MRIYRENGEQVVYNDDACSVGSTITYTKPLNEGCERYTHTHTYTHTLTHTLTHTHTHTH
jgi:hypothetical protein